MKNLPQSTVSIVIARRHVSVLLDHVGALAEDIDFNDGWATVSWHANGGVEELELVQAIMTSGAGEPTVTELV